MVVEEESDDKLLVVKLGEVRGLCLEWIVLQPPLVDGGGRD